VLLTATVSNLRVAIVTSVLADLALNYFFMPPVHTFTIADPQNWVALFAFLAVSVVASNLSTAVRDRASEAMASAYLSLGTWAGFLIIDSRIATTRVLSR
jgi:two-component system, OmpR family, sensor histidine kinase KdpD